VIITSYFNSEFVDYFNIGLLSIIFLQGSPRISRQDIPCKKKKDFEAAEVDTTLAQ
jgi:hypothetical protein